MLLESGVPFMLAYDNTDKHMICRMTEAAQQYCEETKKEAEKHELN